VKDAEAHADEDKRLLETVQARNQADQLLHSVKKSLAEHGDKLDAAERAKIDEAAKALEAVLKEGDKATLEAKTETLSSAAQKLGEKVYAEQQAKTQAAGGAPGGEAPSSGPAKGAKDDGNVVDAEYTEVNDKKPA
jgi:molecular chaperone DnaK